MHARSIAWLVKEMHMLKDKYQTLRAMINTYGKVAVAFSGGVDSTFLVKVCHDVLKENCLACICVADAFPAREKNRAVAFCEKHGIAYTMIPVDVMHLDAFINNPPDRCYHCKKEIFKAILQTAAQRGFDVVCEGSNRDDDSDYRPGHKALSELGICSPLREADLYKEEIRILSKQMGLETWDKPSFACLASRFSYGQTITKEKLQWVEKAEQFLENKGFRQYRVRIHEDLALLEVLPEQMEMLFEMRREIVRELKQIGFHYVTIDLQGFRTGSMNEGLNL